MPENDKGRLARICNSIATAKDPEAQAEIYRIADLVSEVGEDVPTIDAMLQLIESGQPNLIVLREFRNKLEMKKYADDTGRVASIRRKFGGSPVYALLAGVIFAVIATVAVYALIYISVQVMDWTSGVLGGAGPNSKSESAALLQNSIRWIDIGLLCFSATMGACISLISRVDDFAKLYVYDPFLIFVNSLVKPIIACGLAITVYCILHSKIITVSALSDTLTAGLSDSKSKIQYASLLWFFGFIAGFGERFARDLIVRADSIGADPSNGK